MNTAGIYQCENCKRQFPRENAMCPSCEYPIGGTEEEQNIFYDKLETAKSQLKGMEDRVYQSKLCLWIIAGVNFLYALVSYLFQSESQDALLVLLINLAISAIFVILALSANERPYSALIGGLIVYVAMIAYQIIDQQSSVPIFSIFRYSLIIYIAIGINKTSQVEYLKKEIARRTGRAK